MKVLVVGGSGLIGGDAALLLKSKGHDVTIMARKVPLAPVLAAFDFLQCDYIHDDIDDGRLEGFDYLVFAAAADIRNLPHDGSVTPEAFYQQANDIAVPRFFAAAKSAGIKNAVYIGTFYPQVAPNKIGICPYVTSRHNTCEDVLALSDDAFKVSSLNAPFVLGHIPGLPVPHLTALVDYAKGNIPDLPVFAPIGGTNHISSRAIAEAICNIFDKGAAGKAYLIGDENLSWQAYLQLWFDAAGNHCAIPVTEDEHPMFPNIILFAGPGETISFEPDAKEMQVLDYARNTIKALVQEVVDAHA
ncbi:MAG: NAD-dependent epimerase/dehydratase family protein [Pseudomonadales bacterium]|nr:NAD-dependent epimerase/dehydratase family protein [Pseudomonadales bacterium]